VEAIRNHGVFKRNKISKRRSGAILLYMAGLSS